MEGLESFHAHVKNLQPHAGILADALVSLSQSFEAEAEWLTRENEVQQLKTIHATVVEKLAWSRHMETMKRYEHNKMRLTFSLAGLAAKLIAQSTQNRQAQCFANHAFSTGKRNELSYGTVMVCIGPKGMPDDVQVISISELARNSNQPEFEIIMELRKGGGLLFTQEAFTLLIDRLTIEIREGRLHLPIIGNKLSEVMPNSYLMLGSK